MLDLILFIIENEDDKALVTLVYEKYSPILYQYALKRVGDPTVATDITQETFLGFVSNFEKFREQSMDSMYAYLFTIQKNALQRHRVRNNRELFFMSNESIDDIPSDEDVNALISSNEQYNEILTTIHKMQPIYSDILILHLVNEVSLKRIAKSLDQPYDTIKKRYSRGLKALTTALEKERDK